MLSNKESLVIYYYFPPGQRFKVPSDSGRESYPSIGSLLQDQEGPGPNMEIVSNCLWVVREVYESLYER